MRGQQSVVCRRRGCAAAVTWCRWWHKRCIVVTHGSQEPRTCTFCPALHLGAEIIYLPMTSTLGTDAVSRMADDSPQQNLLA
eukprot:m.1399075 g.1399075  ORF g.1399075 m.1399075 type:complete len:82 (+) comp25000_c0_seq5:1195-1440(+)